MTAPKTDGETTASQPASPQNRSSKGQAPPPHGRRGLVFRLAFFFGLVFLSIQSMESQWVQTNFLEPISLLSAKVVALLLNDMGYDAITRNGATIVAPSQSFAIAAECAGLQILFFYGAALLIFPATVRAKLLGLVAGVGVSLVLNTVRIMAIIMVTLAAGGGLWFMHVVVGQAMVIAGTLAAFLVWARWAAGESFPLLAPGRPWRLAGLFAIGFLAAYTVHFAVFSSALGTLLQQAIPAHATAVLSLFTEAAQSGQVIRTGATAVRLTPGCMSGPVAVFIMAGVFMLPFAWWKKLGVIVLGYLPLAYLYYLTRTVTLVLALGSSSKETSFLYNYFGVSLLCAAALAAFWAHESWAARTRPAVRSAIMMLVSAVLALGLAWLTGVVNRATVLPAVVSLVADAGRLTLDIKRTLTGMADVNAFLWCTLTLWTVRWPIRRRLGAVAAGMAASMVHSWLVILCVESITMQPPYYVLKIWAVLLPCAVFWLFSNGRRKVADSIG